MLFSGRSSGLMARESLRDKQRWSLCEGML
jgi:hypothetical protein